MKNLLHFLGMFFLLFFVVFFSGNILTKASSIGFDVLDSSGDRMSGGEYILDSNVGQPSADSSSGGNYNLSTGFRQDFISGSYISIDIEYPSGTDAVLPAVSGFLSGETGDGYVDATVTTDYDGYVLAIKSDTSPALKCDTLSGCETADAFSDYTPVGGIGTPDYSWAIDNNESAFGFTVKGDHILSKYKYNTGTTSCGSGDALVSGNYCWDGLSTTNVDISSSIDINHPDGTPTRIKFRSQVGSDKIQPSGGYKAGIILTATANS
jgi:hypothetical protein